MIGEPIPYHPGRRNNRPVRLFVCSADGESILTTGSLEVGATRVCPGLGRDQRPASRPPAVS